MMFWVRSLNPVKCWLGQVCLLWLMDDELADPAVQARMAELDGSVREKIGVLSIFFDEEVDPELADLLPTVPAELFLQEDVEYKPFERG
jgi:hypothetical protein